MLATSASQARNRRWRSTARTGAGAFPRGACRRRTSSNHRWAAVRNSSSRNMSRSGSPTGLELVAPEAQLVSADDQLALAVLRYDRQYDPAAGRWTRWHQEDLAQAMGEPTAVRYEANGAPGVAQVVAFLRQRSSDPAADELRFLQAVALNWILIGTDAHLRNYSVLLGARGDVRLAPFYDIASALDIARRHDLDTLKLAMQVGGEYRAAAITAAHWAALETELGYPTGALVAAVVALAGAIPEALAAVEGEFATCPGKLHTPGQHLVKRIAQRARGCLRDLTVG